MVIMQLHVHSLLLPFRSAFRQTTIVRISEFAQSSFIICPYDWKFGAANENTPKAWHRNQRRPFSGFILYMQDSYPNCLSVGLCETAHSCTHAYRLLKQARAIIDSNANDHTVGLLMGQMFQTLEDLSYTSA